MASYSYLGMELRVGESDTINQEYFAHCAQGHFSLQACSKCSLLRYPPSVGCPWCGDSGYTWKQVEGRGTVYSYSEVTHAVQPGFAKYTPYMVVLVELDTQRGQPSAHEGLRILANLVTPDGALAPAEQVAQVGIGTRLRMAFTQIAPEMALPQWTIDPDAPAVKPWRPVTGRTSSA